MVINEIELEQQLKEGGNKLLDPPSSADELLNMLDKLECLLINVEQASPRSMQDSLLPAMKALISNAILRNSDADVKVLVASCLSEISRITAPDPPYSDEHMKEYFYLIVAAFEKLSHGPSRFYMKAVSIIDTVAKVRSCLIMLDLGLDQLIVKMFELFLKIIRSNHPHSVFLAMEAIMTLIIDESDDISRVLLAPLLASVRKENQIASPMAWKLGKNVIINSAAKLRPYLKEAVQYEGRAFDAYTPIIASICQNEAYTVICDHVNGSGDYLVSKEQLSPDAASPGQVLHGVDFSPQPTSQGDASAGNAGNVVNYNSTDMLEPCSLVQNKESTEAQCNADPEVKMETVLVTIPRKRGRKPNSLMNPEEGYDHCWIPAARKGASNPSPDQKSLPDGNHHKRGRPKKHGSNMNQHADPSSLQVSKMVDTKHEEKALTKYEVSSRKQSEGRSNTEVKRHKESRKSGLAAKTAKETSLPSAYMLSSEKDDILSEPEEKPLIGTRSTEEDGLPMGKDTRKRSLVISITTVGAAGSRIKKTKSSDRDGNHTEEVPTKSLKRKRTPRKEMPFETPELDEQLTGRRIKVWWPLDRVFYEGVINSYDPVKKKHMILYADGDIEMLNLRRQRWELVGDDNFPDKVQVTDNPKVDSSSEHMIRQQGKGKVKSESANQQNFDVKRRRPSSISKRKTRTSGGESAGGPVEDEPGFVDKAINGTSWPDRISDHEGKSSSKKLKIKNTMTGIKSEPITLEDESHPMMAIPKVH